MTGAMAGSAVREPSESVEDAGDQTGRIPFRIRVGVTGHRRLVNGVETTVQEQLERVHGMLKRGRQASATDFRFSVISQLAEGADRVVVDCVFDHATKSGHDARLEVVLPFPRDQYVRLQQFSEDSLRRFDDLLELATFCIEPDERLLRTDGDRADAYAAAGTKVIRRCDVLVAIWDGQPAGGKRGGTAHTLLTAAAQGKPCIWIPSNGAERPTDNLTPGSSRSFFERVMQRSRLDLEYRPSASLREWSLQPLVDRFEALEDYNREPRPWDHRGSGRVGFGQRVAGLVDAVTDQRFATRFSGGLREAVSNRLVSGTPPSIAAPLARASLLSGHYHKRFMAYAAQILACASLAACSLAVGVAVGRSSPIWPALELAFLLLAASGFLVIRELGVHSRWLSYRVLAERLRTARYLAVAGFDFRDYAQLQGGWVGNPPEQWLTRSVEEIWDSTPHAANVSASELESLKRLLAEEWLQGQIDYHTRAEEKHKQVTRRLPLILWPTIGGTLLLAILELVSVAIGAHPTLQRFSEIFLIAVPVTLASIGAWLTINQHDALQARSAQMQEDLLSVKQDIVDAHDICVVRQGAAAATRLIAPETSTWLGHLWFLDIEHP